MNKPVNMYYYLSVTTENTLIIIFKNYQVSWALDVLFHNSLLNTIELVERRNSNDALPWQDISFYLLSSSTHTNQMQASDWLTDTHKHTHTLPCIDSQKNHMLRLNGYSSSKAVGGRAQILRIRHRNQKDICVYCALCTLLLLNKSMSMREHTMNSSIYWIYYLSFISS